MIMKRMLLTVLVAAGCAGAPTSEDVEAEAEIAALTTSEPVAFPALAADLYFKPNVVDVFTSSGAAYSLPYGGTIDVPCNTSWVRVRYRYVNGGVLAAAAHSNRSFVVGLPSQV